MRAQLTGPEGTMDGMTRKEQAKNQSTGTSGVERNSWRKERPRNEDFEDGFICSCDLEPVRGEDENSSPHTRRQERESQI